VPDTGGLNLLRLLAVGLLRRSELPLALRRALAGAFSGVGATPALARLDAVGVKSREEEAGVVVVLAGVFAGVEVDGVLDRALVDEGVFGRVDRDGARGVVSALREGAWGPVVAVDRAGVEVLVDVRGLEGVVAADPPVGWGRMGFPGVNEDGGPFDAVAFGVLRPGVALAGSAFDRVRAGVRADVEDVDLMVVGVLGSEAGVLGVCRVSVGSSGGAGTGSGAGSGTGSGCGAFSSFSSALNSSAVSSAGAFAEVMSDPTLSADIRFQLVGGLTLPAAAAPDFGGHSRFSFASARVASPDALKLDVAESERAPGGVVAVFCLCCSNRPIRFWTLARGRSSGSGLCTVINRHSALIGHQRTCRVRSLRWPKPTARCRAGRLRPVVSALRLTRKCA
jgi:hypothetical protein